MSSEFNHFLSEAGIQREHSVRDTPQQLGVAERMNRSLAKGITTALSQSGLTCTWWEDAAIHWLHGKIRLPSSVTAPLTPFELFYGQKPSLSQTRPFGCLACIHLQKDQHPPLTSHAAQCILIGYPKDYKAWKFWDPQTCREIISDSAVFRKSIFPFRKSSLLDMNQTPTPSTPRDNSFTQPTPDVFHFIPLLNNVPPVPPVPAPPPPPSPVPAPEPEPQPPAPAPPAPRLALRIGPPPSTCLSDQPPRLQSSN